MGSYGEFTLRNVGLMAEATSCDGGEDPNEQQDPCVGRGRRGSVVTVSILRIAAKRSSRKLGFLQLSY
jgi:hypothetical protein